MSEIVYWDVLNHGGRAYYMATTDKGIADVSLGEHDYEGFHKGVQKRIKQAQIIHAPERLAECKRQLDEFLSGQRQEFDLPLDLRGTEFQKAVWQATVEIPFGQTCSYADIARAIDNPKAVRAVGGALNKNPVPIIVPCHRVIGKNGALVGFGGGLPVKVQLLQLEGVYMTIES